MPSIQRDIAKSFAVGQGTASGTAAVLTASTAKASRGVVIIPAAANTGIIEAGLVGVTYGAGVVVPASGLTIPIQNAGLIYLIASAAGQNYSYMII